MDFLMWKLLPVLTLLASSSAVFFHIKYSPKVQAAENNIYVNVGFWFPGNAHNSTAPEAFLEAGVLGLNSFRCPSQINHFPITTAGHFKVGLSVLVKSRRPLLVHAEVELESVDYSKLEDEDPRLYSTYLKTRPASWEEAAIRGLLSVTEDTIIVGAAEGAHLHVIHLSEAGSSLDLIKEAKSLGHSITVKICPNYLAFSAEEIKDRDTRFKCAPPMHGAEIRKKLWEALMEGNIDLLSSDHSPTPPELKRFDDGNFLRAWGGISSLEVEYYFPTIRMIPTIQASRCD